MLIGALDWYLDNRAALDGVGQSLEVRLTLEELGHNNNRLDFNKDLPTPLQ